MHSGIKGINMKEQKCKTCGAVVQSSEEFCPECGCRCSRPIKISSKYAFTCSIIALLFALSPIVIDTVSGSNYDNLYLVLIYGIITIIFSIISLFQSKALSKNLISIIICVFAIAISFVFRIHNITVLNFNPDKCNHVFDITPEEFEAQNGYGTMFYGNTTSVKVDKDGNLILKIDRKQKEKIKQKCLSVIHKAGSADIIFSDNYDRITVKAYRETYPQNVFKAFPTLDECFIYQLLNHENINCDDIEVDFVVLDAKNGKEIVNIAWFDNNYSDKEISFDLEIISSMYE